MVFKVLQLPWHVAAPGQSDLTIRRLGPKDCDTFIAHLHELNFDDFRDRFNGVVSDHWLLNYVGKSLKEATVLGAFDGGHLIAVSELHCEGGTPKGYGESAFSVASCWRRKGIGTLLITALLEAARENDVHTVLVETGPQNIAMRELARKFGATMHYEDCMSVGQINVAEGLATAECSIAKFKPIVFEPAGVEHLRLTA